MRLRSCAALLAALYATLPVALAQPSTGQPLFVRDAEIEKSGRAFLEILLNQNEAALATYAPSGDSLLKDGRLDQYLRDYLYVSKPDRGELSVLDIASKGALDIAVHRQSPDVVVLVFVPAQYRERLSSITFLEAAFLESYFACRFDVSNGQFKLTPDFCFSETDGPFSAH